MAFAGRSGKKAGRRGNKLRRCRPQMASRHPPGTLRSSGVTNRTGPLRVARLARVLFLGQSIGLSHRSPQRSPRRTDELTCFRQYLSSPQSPERSFLAIHRLKRPMLLRPSAAKAENSLFIGKSPVDTFGNETFWGAYFLGNSRCLFVVHAVLERWACCALVVSASMISCYGGP